MHAVGFLSAAYTHSSLFPFNLHSHELGSL